jgi:hypothetical protein
MTTIDSAFRSLSLDLMTGAVSHGNPATRSRLAEAYWDLQYFYKYGVPDIRDYMKLIEPPFPSQPQPDPSPIDAIARLEGLVFDLSKIALGDPHPEPNITSVLGDRAARLSGAKFLSARLTKALKALNKEIEQLQK